MSVGQNITVLLECSRNWTSMYGVHLDIHTTDSNSTPIVANFFFPGDSMFLTNSSVTFRLNAENDIWFSYCYLILYNASNVPYEFIPFNRTCFIADGERLAYMYALLDEINQGMFFRVT